MKYTAHLIVASLIVSSTFVFATAQNNSEDIKLMINEIKNAPQETRFEKVNAFKQELRTMNAQNRQEALGELHAAMSQEGTQTRTQTQTQKGNQEGTKTQTKTQTRTQNKANQPAHIQNQNMQRMQQQNMQMQQQNQAKRMQQGMQNPVGQGKK